MSAVDSGKASFNPAAYKSGPFGTLHGRVLVPEAALIAALEGTPASTYSKENRCRVWLKELVKKVEKQGKDATIPTKSDVRTQAVGKFEISRRAFENRIWPAVVPDTWKRRGPKTRRLK